MDRGAYLMASAILALSLLRSCVRRQMEVEAVQAAAEDAAHGAEQHQLAVVGRGRAQRTLQLLHHLKGTQERLLTAPTRSTHRKRVLGLTLRPASAE